MSRSRESASQPVERGSARTDTVHGRVLVLLILTALLHVVYPVTLGGGAASLIGYNVLYAGMFLAGIFVASDSRPHLIAAVVMALAWLLLRYIFSARAVTRDVLYAAVTVYILIGALFVPVYGALELLAPGAFIDNGTGQPVFWQQFIYFSLVTLTTSGYGDILPVSGWARAVANIEQVIGVLYIAILMARLVGLYTQPQESGGQA